MGWRTLDRLTNYTMVDKLHHGSQHQESVVEALAQTLRVLPAKPRRRHSPRSRGAACTIAYALGRADVRAARRRLLASGDLAELELLLPSASANASPSSATGSTAYDPRQVGSHRRDDARAHGQRASRQDDRAPVLTIGAPSLAETAIVLSARLGHDAQGLVARFIQELGVRCAFGTPHWQLASEAFVRYGKDDMRRHSISAIA